MSGDYWMCRRCECEDACAIDEAVKEERERAAAIVDNLATSLSTEYVDPEPKYNTPHAIQEMHGRLARIAADAIRKP